MMQWFERCSDEPCDNWYFWSVNKYKEKTKVKNVLACLPVLFWTLGLFGISDTTLSPQLYN